MTNFDLVARPYRWLEYLSFGPCLERCRFQHLGQLGRCRKALVLGDGDGRFTAKLLAANPEIAVEAVDSSAAMLGLLARRAARLGPAAVDRLQAVEIDALDFRPAPANAYDLVVTHFFLDCFSEKQIDQLLVRILPNLAPGAGWLVSEFAIPERGIAAPASRLVIAALYRAFGLLAGLKTRRLPGYAAIFRRNGLRLVEEKAFLGGMLTSQLWKLGIDPGFSIEPIPDTAPPI